VPSAISKSSYLIIRLGSPTVYSADLAFWLLMLLLLDPNSAFRATYHLGVAKSAETGVGQLYPDVAKVT